MPIGFNTYDVQLALMGGGCRPQHGQVDLSHGHGPWHHQAAPAFPRAPTRPGPASCSARAGPPGALCRRCPPYAWSHRRGGRRRCAPSCGETGLAKRKDGGNGCGMDQIFFS